MRNFPPLNLEMQVKNLKFWRAAGDFGFLYFKELNG